MSGIPANTLIQNDPLLKDLPVQKYAQLASDESIFKASKALEGRGVSVQVTKNKEEALQQLKNSIAEGASVYNCCSTSLLEIGFFEFAKNNPPFKNLNQKISEEKDPQAQAVLRKDTTWCDVFLGSVCAITENGDMVVCDASGSRVANFPYGASKVVLIVGTQKIVPTLEDAIKRMEDYCYALESARVRVAYKIEHSQISNVVTIKGSNPFGGKRFHVIFVKECLGY